MGTRSDSWRRSSRAFMCGLIGAFVAHGEALQAQSSPVEVFGEGVLTETGADAYGPTLNADGTEVYFTVRRNRSGSEYLVFSHRSNGAWAAPAPLAFSGQGYDKEPYLSPDGLRLFFASTRPVPSGAALEFEIWVADRTEGGWSAPRHLEEIGSPGYDNYPAVAANGDLYFGSDRLEGRGRIFHARWNGANYDEPVLVTTEGDRPMTGADPYIDPQSRFLIHSSTRSGGRGEGDLYLTLREGADWGPSVHLGDIVNTADYEYTPFVSADEQHLYFSRGWGEMHRVPVSALPALSRALGGR